MKKLLGILVLGLLFCIGFADESNAYRPKKFIVDCELKDGMFKSSFTNFDKKDIKRFKDKNLSFNVDTVSNKITSTSDELLILHGIIESQDLINFEQYIKKTRGKSKYEKEQAWEKWKKYEEMHKFDLIWMSELIIEEEPLTKYKYESTICLLCRASREFLKIEIVEYGGFGVGLGLKGSDLNKENLKKNLNASIQKAVIAKNQRNPYTLTPTCKWKAIPD